MKWVTTFGGDGGGGVTKRKYVALNMQVINRHRFFIRTDIY
jgi:hypothetical protein